MRLTLLRGGSVLVADFGYLGEEEERRGITDTKEVMVVDSCTHVFSEDGHWMDLKLRGGKQVERWMGFGAEEPVSENQTAWLSLEDAGGLKNEELFDLETEPVPLSKSPFSDAGEKTKELLPNGVHKFTVLIGKTYRQVGFSKGGVKYIYPVYTLFEALGYAEIKSTNEEKEQAYWVIAADGTPLKFKWVDVAMEQVDSNNKVLAAYSVPGIPIAEFAKAGHTVEWNRADTMVRIMAMSKYYLDIPQDERNLGTIVSYMGYHMITSKTSNQYRLKADAESNGRYSISKPEYYAMIDDRMAIATKQSIGGIFEVSVGDYVDVKFQTNDGAISTYKCIIGDAKGGDAPNPWGHYDGQGIVEIIYHDYNSPEGYNIIAPDKSNNPWGKGCVLRITKVGSYYD